MITAEELNTLARRASKDSLAHGYKDNEHSVGRLLTKAAMEVAEVFEAKRNGRIANRYVYDQALTYLPLSRSHNLWSKMFNDNYHDRAKDTIQDEIADVAIYILVAAGHFGYVFTEEDVQREFDYFIDDEEWDFVDSCGELMMQILNREGCGTREGMCLKLLNILVTCEAWTNQEAGDDLWYWVQQKMEYNRTRPYLHGHKNDKDL